ncbi:MAG TPA: CDP-alcohol phosphatidyltransferase family protein [Kofleriaceae bacterium]|jgi:phosphatidylglycerophosphate synthase|nr:CDP-alcohol phosphatidyltransferase family protein [Kofleriaceae bacterium]
MASNLNPANAVTASRFLTLPPFVWAVDNGYPQWATLLLLICGVLDLFDGMVARLFRCQTPFGEVFDAIADGFCYGFALLVLTAYGWVPWQPVAIIIVLGLINTYFRFVYARRAGRTTNYRSFAMERLVAFAAYLGGFGTSGLEVDYFYWTFTALLAIVVVHDAKRMAIDPVPPARPAVDPAAAVGAGARADGATPAAEVAS